MQTRIIESASRILGESLGPAPRVLAVERPFASAISLLLEPPAGGRRWLVLDVDPRYASIHTTPAGRSVSDEARTGVFGERLLGGRLIAVEPGSEPRVRRLVFAQRAMEEGSSGGTRLVLVAEFTGRSGNLRVLDADGNVLESLLSGGPIRGEEYESPHARAAETAGAWSAAVLAEVLASRPPLRWPREIGRIRGDVSRLQIVDAILRSSGEHLAEEVFALLEAERGRPEAERERQEVEPARTEAAHETPARAALYQFPRSSRIEWPIDWPIESSIMGQVSPEALGLPAAEVLDLDLPALAPFLHAAPADLMELLARAHAANHAREREDDRRAVALQLVRRETARLLRLRENLLRERGDEGTGKRLRGFGEALLAHLHAVPRRAEVFRCPAWSEDPEAPEMVIPLDPARTPAENAQEYFHRARRWDRGEPHRIKRLAAIDKGVSQLSTLASRWEALDQLPTETAIARAVTEALGVLRSSRGISLPSRKGDREDGATGAGRGVDRASTARNSGTSDRTGGSSGSGASRGSDRSGRSGVTGGQKAGAAGAAGRDSSTGKRAGSGNFRPRSFTTREGWTVLVGRSNKENDYLTHRMAHPEDYWFHAHGVPGSHVVLRREGRKSNPSAKTLEEAASIAAFYSKARHSGRVPVIYTLKKHVRKPRQSKPGLAACTREKMIMVPPKNPEDGVVPEWMDEE